MERASGIDVSMVSEIRRYNETDTSVLNTLIYINGISFYPWNDMKEFVKSTFKDGDYWIPTCGIPRCVPGCHGIFEGVKIRYSGNVVKWKVRRPIQTIQDTDGEYLPVEGYDIYRFDRVEYMTAINNALETGKKIVASSTHPVEFVGQFRSKEFLGLKTADIAMKEK